MTDNQERALSPEERQAAEEEQEFLKYLALTRPPLASEVAGDYLHRFAFLRPCRSDLTNPDIS